MIENTSREIIVKKFFEKNRFLNDDFQKNIPLKKRKKYTQANLIFDSTSDLKDIKPWLSDRSRYCVLSSGGKDSLLSYSLLNEIELNVYPIFVNESGRHWFTALNAYRYLSENNENTSRVWTNSDRVFSWMLRRLPFIRKDFSQVRSDEYPIRLWTVAIFLFAILPLVKKHKICRIIVGDEYDTTGKYKHNGVLHYNGLYDQSRFFDNTITRYYIQKQWNISQFSLLRPLSEILIEKILVERYPDIQKLQVSCHSTHVENKKVYPCGVCEKCRRIISMLIALKADPNNCGYSKKHISKCLKELTTKGIRQEKPAIEHLYYLLNKKQILSNPINKNISCKKHPEIMKLRFDKEKSPPNTIPLDIRKKINPNIDNQFLNPYPFETPSKTNYSNIMYSNEIEKDYCVFSRLTWPEAKKTLKKVDLALLPVGAIEQHGPHLPLDTDAFDADYLAKQVALHCKDPKPIVLPLIPYGVSYHHDDFSGTISISPDTLSRLVYEIGINLSRQGITKLVIINGHGGNTPSLKFAAQLINRDANIFTTVDTGETSDTDISSIIETIGDVHSGEIETSTALATRPNLVYMKKAKAYIPDFSNRYLDFSSKKSIEWYARTAKISPNGILGDPTKASVEKGQIIWELMINNLVEFVEHIKNMSLDEIYQRRY
jgi:creatinine amidohydrolase/Fe(II)-dependent formamide hydrolase-like protein